MKKVTALIQSANGSLSLSSVEDIVKSLFTFKLLSESPTIEMDTKQSWAGWIQEGVNFGLDNVITDVHALLRKNPSVKASWFETLQTSLSKIGETTPAASRVLSRLVWTLNDLPNDTNPNDLMKLINKSL